MEGRRGIRHCSDGLIFTAELADRNLNREEEENFAINVSFAKYEESSRL